MPSTTTLRNRIAGRERAREQDDEAPEQVKHTIQLPVKLWTEFGARARRIGVTKSALYKHLKGLGLSAKDFGGSEVDDESNTKE